MIFNMLKDITYLWSLERIFVFQKSVRNLEKFNYLQASLTRIYLHQYYASEILSFSSVKCRLSQLSKALESECKT